MMKISILFWSFVLVIAFSLCQGQLDCRSQWCTRTECKAPVGTVITIPCGNLINQTVTYINRSDDSILISNVTNICLTLNLTVFDNNILITCQPSQNFQAGSFTYSISVTYSPRIIIPMLQSPGQFERPHDLICPLQGNPTPIYSSWDIFHCVSNTPTNPLGISLTNGNRTLHIAKLSLEFMNICFNCTACNELGCGWYYFTPISFNFCSASVIQLFLEPNNSTVSVMVGESIELTCSAIPVGFLESCASWTFNESITESSYMHNEFTCLEKRTLLLTNVTHEDSGNYTCVCDQPRSSRIERTIELKVFTNKAPNTIASQQGGGFKRQLAIAIPILLSIVIASIVIIVISVILLLYKHKFNQSVVHSTDTEMDISVSIKDINYDLFISFAESDRSYVENELKINLEKKGYKIAWHHDVFIPGFSILENMEKFIFASRLTIVVLSDNFIQSDFCMKELHIALRKEKEIGLRCVIPVLLTDINTSSIPEVLSKKTYLSFEDKHFQDKLQTALGEPQDPSP